MIRGRLMTAADLRHDGNIFNFLRVLLASLVIFSHGYVLTGNLDPSESALPFSVSRLAVLLFFTLSGFLVTNSLQLRGVRQFAVARGLRMLPGLWVMLVVSAIAVSVMFGPNAFGQIAGDTSVWRYIARNALLVGGNYSIDNVFAANPLPNVVNGSLWTIPREIQCYIALAIIGGTGLLGRRSLLLALFVAGIGFSLIVPVAALGPITALVPLAISFFAGVMLFLWRDKVWLSWPLAITALVLVALTPAGDLRALAAQLSLAYVALVLAMIVPAGLKRASARMSDYSFGIYIYAFPVQQAVIATGIGTTPASNMIAAFLLTLPLAALSWHLVEKPALALKGRAQAFRRKIPTAA